METSRGHLIAGLFLVATLALGIVFIFGGFAAPTVLAQTNSRQAAQSNRNATPANPIGDAVDPIAPGETPETLGSFEIVKRLLIAVILSGILAFRPRKNVPLFRRSLFVSQSQILLAVVAAALMMIVGDNAARAFAIFAAASLVRFRTNIRDPKEITVLLISLALGLAAGFGRWDLGVALCLFSLALLWLLEFNESALKVRSMELTVKTRNPEKTQEILKKIFRRAKIEAEIREIVPASEGKPVGSITYYLNLPLDLTTDKLSDRIMAADPHDTEGMQWSKTKNASDIYQ